MGGMCCRRRTSDDSDDDAADAEVWPGWPLFEPSPEVPEASPDADADPSPEVPEASPDADAVSPHSVTGETQGLPCPSWGNSFFAGRELRRRAGMDSQSRDIVDQASQSDS